MTCFTDDVQGTETNETDVIFNGFPSSIRDDCGTWKERVWEQRYDAYNSHTQTHTRARLRRFKYNIQTGILLVQLFIHYVDTECVRLCVFLGWSVVQLYISTLITNTCLFRKKKKISKKCEDYRMFIVCSMSIYAHNRQLFYSLSTILRIVPLEALTYRAVFFHDSFGYLYKILLKSSFKICSLITDFD